MSTEERDTEREERPYAHTRDEQSATPPHDLEYTEARV